MECVSTRFADHLLKSTADKCHAIAKSLNQRTFDLVWGKTLITERRGECVGHWQTHLTDVMQNPERLVMNEKSRRDISRDSVNYTESFSLRYPREVSLIGHGELTIQSNSLRGRCRRTRKVTFQPFPPI
jgi:hypothetical protein